MASKKIEQLPFEQKKGLVSMDCPLSIKRQCELLRTSRSGYYYKERGESELNIELMKEIDEQYMRTPFYGVRRMVEYLRGKGYRVNPKRVRRLMRGMAIEAIYPRRSLSRTDNTQAIYPYLLRGLEIRYSDQVWCSDITYIRLKRGYAYLVVVMDWYSRYVISWGLSITLDSGFCVEAVKKALEIGKPEIFNSDRGVQYMSKGMRELLEGEGIRISMDGRGRVSDNIFVERLWRTLKYEEVYLKEYGDVWEAEENIREYFKFYNTVRPHSALNYRTPEEVYRMSKRGNGKEGTNLVRDERNTKLNFGNFLS